MILIRKRGPLLIGGGIAVLVASQFFNFGIGFRGGSQNEASDVADAPDASTDSSPAETPPVLTDAQAEPTEDLAILTPPSSSTPTAPVVCDVLIVGDRYMVATDPAAPELRTALSIDEVLAMTGRVAGESSGIRIRIARTPSAIALAESALLRRLTDAGVSDDQVDSRRQLVE